MEFFNDHAVLLRALLLGLVAIGFGIGLTGGSSSSPPARERMREIGRAIQEGADAYLTPPVHRRSRVVAVVPFLLLGFYEELGWGTAIGFLVGAVLSAAAGFIGMNVAVRSNMRTAEAAKSGLAPGAERRVPRGLGHRAARRRPRAARRRGLLLGAHRWLDNSPESRDRRPRRARLRRLADLRLRASRRRHLHEGRRRRRRPRREDRGRHPRGRPAQPGRDRGQRRRQRRRLRRAWPPTCSRRTPSPPSR